MKALVIQPAFLGDAIISLALAEELRRLSPDAKISYLVRPESAPIIRLSPSVNKVFAYDKYGSESGITGINKKAEELNKEGFDTIFSLHNSKRTQMLLERLNAPIKIGYGSKGLTQRVEEIREQQTSRAARLLLSIFPNADLSALPKLQASEAALPNAIRNLPRPIITIAPDSVWKTKQWGIQKYQNLINMLISKNFSIILTGFSKDLDLANSFNYRNDNILSLINKTSLEELVSVIAFSDLLISNDSAPVHIATAVRTPSITIFGPTVPGFGFAPPKELGTVIEMKDLWCRPCTSHGSNECPIHTHECMKMITPEIVFETALQRVNRIGA